MTFALVTGGSKGIGFELARGLAREGLNLVLVARDEGKLEEAKGKILDEFKIEVRVIPKDLSKPDAARELFDELRQEKIRINTLVNNAGFGDYGLFKDSSLETQTNMISLNITSLVTLTHLFLPGIIEDKGSIINLASTASFQPVPYMSVYGASKAFVLSFSEALSEELRDTGVKVLALCPGATKTGFQSRARIKPNGPVKGDFASPRQVAEFGLGALKKNKVVAIHGFKNYLFANTSRFFTRNATRRMTRKFMEE